jgi:formamidopyrimidine-DNA glycosylase
MEGTMRAEPKSYIMFRMLLSSHQKLAKLSKAQQKPMTEVLEEVLTKAIEGEPSDER